MEYIEKIGGYMLNFDEEKEKLTQKLSEQYALDIINIAEYERLLEYINKIETKKEINFIEKITQENSNEYNELTIAQNNEIIKKSRAQISVRCEKKFGWSSCKVKIFVDGNFIRDVKGGDTVSFEIENGKHIIYCEEKHCEISDAFEIKADSNEICFSVTYPSASTTMHYKVILTKIKETENSRPPSMAGAS